MATWDISKMKHHILLCNGSSCNNSGAEELTISVRNEISKRDLDNIIHTTRTRCNGRCQDKCVAIVYPQGVWYKELTGEDASSLIDSLVDGAIYEQKVSHTFGENGFVRAPGVVIGVEKDKTKVKKVSKTY
ncbi:MAG: (2Fe-2S) ferredoxin domain-containing protein [Bacillaceae bacterium]|nr:(2Fe-2S) ferredoxin domain-containing protein [Bacillaceae bacterium]